MGNVLLAYIAAFCSDSIAAPAGWINYASQVGGQGLCVSLYFRSTEARDGKAYLFTESGIDAIGGVLQEWKGADNAVPWGGYAIGSGGGGPTISTPPATPSALGSIAVGVLLPATVTAVNPNPGYTIDQNPQSPGDYHTIVTAISDVTTTAATPVRTTFNILPNVAFSEAMIVFMNPVNGPAASALSLKASQSRVTDGTGVSLAVNASPASVTGTVEFIDAATGSSIAHCVLNGGACSANTTGISPGKNTIVARIRSSSAFGPSTSAPITITNTSAIVRMSTSKNVYVAGTAVDLQATVIPDSATGKIAFKDGMATLGTCTLGPLPGPDPNGGGGPIHTYSGCILPNEVLAPGAHSLIAVYSGDAALQGGSSERYVNQVRLVASSPSSCSAIALGLNGSLNGYIPAINDWYHMRIDDLPADPNSDAAISELKAHSPHAHMDFGSAQYGYSGIPYVNVDSSVHPGLTFGIANNGKEEYANESDVLKVWPGTDSTVWIESHYLDSRSDPKAGVTDGDNHMIVFDKATCAIYELYHAQHHPGANPALTASASTIWDASSRAVPQQRAVGITSADAAGLSLFEGLVRYDEVASGHIHHAIRMTTDALGCHHHSNGDCKNNFYLPLTHTSYVPGGRYLNYGTRLRLKADYNISHFSAANQVILTAVKQYGLIIADLGSANYWSGTSDNRWNQDDLSKIGTIPASAFEMVEAPTPYAPDLYPAGAAASVVSFKAEPPAVAAGACTKLEISLANNPSYSVIDGVGFFSGTTKTFNVCPKQTTTYTLTTTNQFLAGDDGHQDGHRNTATITVKVQPTPNR